MTDLSAMALGFHADLRDRSWLYARGLTDRTIDQARLGYVQEGRHADAISIPYFSATGSVQTIRFRYLGPSKHKYDSLRGASSHLYDVRNTSQARVWICEGEFDAMILTQMGYPAVGVPGAGAFKPEWRYLFVGSDEVSLVFDGDEAGTRGAQRLAGLLGDVVRGDLRVIRLPEGMDVTDLYLRDREALRELVS